MTEHSVFRHSDRVVKLHEKHKVGLIGAVIMMNLCSVLALSSSHVFFIFVYGLIVAEYCTTLANFKVGEYMLFTLKDRGERE